MRKLAKRNNRKPTFDGLFELFRFEYVNSQYEYFECETKSITVETKPSKMKRKGIKKTLNLLISCILIKTGQLQYTIQYFAEPKGSVSRD